MASLLKQYEVILSYNDGQEQDVYTVTGGSDISEAMLVASCFGAAEDMKALIKISFCMVGAMRKGKKLTREEYNSLTLPEFLAKRNGKYYFNPDENKDADTQYWSSFRDAYVQLWGKHFGKKGATAREQADFKQAFVEQWNARGVPVPRDES